MKAPGSSKKIFYKACQFGKRIIFDAVKQQRTRKAERLTEVIVLIGHND